MDCIFGMKNFRNEIVWCYAGGGVPKQDFPRKHDIIFRYSKSNKIIFNVEYRKYGDIGSKRATDLGGTRKTEYRKEGTPLNDWWVDLKPIINWSKERTGYPTQKPIKLLERIIKASSNEGDIVLDPFCGCATTCIAAEKLNRNWIGIDISFKAYDLVRERLKKEVNQDLNNWGKRVNYTTEVPKYDDIGKKESGYVYIISNPAFKGKYKIGIASDPKKRLNSYQTSDPARNFKLVYSKKTPKYKEIEKHIIDNYESEYEWVKGKLEKIIKDIDGFYML